MASLAGCLAACTSLERCHIVDRLCGIPMGPKCAAAKRVVRRAAFDLERRVVSIAWARVRFLSSFLISTTEEACRGPREGWAGYATLVQGQQRWYGLVCKPRRYLTAIPASSPSWATCRCRAHAMDIPTMFVYMPQMPPLPRAFATCPSAQRREVSNSIFYAVGHCFITLVTRLWLQRTR